MWKQKPVMEPRHVIKYKQKKQVYKQSYEIPVNICNILIFNTSTAFERKYGKSVSSQHTEYYGSHVEKYS